MNGGWFPRAESGSSGWGYPLKVGLLLAFIDCGLRASNVILSPDVFNHLFLCDLCSADIQDRTISRGFLSCHLSKLFNISVAGSQ